MDWQTSDNGQGEVILTLIDQRGGKPCVWQIRKLFTMFQLAWVSHFDHGVDGMYDTIEEAKRVVAERS